MARLTPQQAGALDRDAFVARFGALYEHAPWVAEAAWESRPFARFAALNEAFAAAVRGAPPERRLALLRAHPELAVDRALTAASRTEQAGAGLDRLAPAHREALARLNAAYRERFGFPFIVAVRDQTVPSLLAQAEARLAHDPAQEAEVALAQVVRIGELRLRDLVASEAAVLARTAYGKADVRLVKVVRGPDEHGLRDLRVDIALEGDFTPAYRDGDNADLLATDTMRNAAYALAQEHLTGPAEAFALVLARHHLAAGPTVETARVRIAERPWARLTPHAFQRAAGGTRIAQVTASASGETVSAGIEDLVVLRTTGSGWAGFQRDALTTLPETDDRVLATEVTATWDYAPGKHDYDGLWTGVQAALLAAFADHYSPSVQFSLRHMGEAVLAAHPDVERISLVLPNIHHLPVDLARFGMEDEHAVFHATSEPYGRIEGTIERA